MIEILASSIASFWWIIPILIVLGLVFSLVEAAIPGFGIFGIMGIIMFLGGIVMYGFVVQVAWKIVVFSLVIVLVIVALFLLLVYSARHGKLSMSSFVLKETDLPVDYDLDAMITNSKYIEKIGQTQTDCKPVGTMRIDNEVIEVYAKNGMIQAGTIVKVVSVDENKIFVEVEE